MAAPQINLEQPGPGDRHSGLARPYAIVTRYLESFCMSTCPRCRGHLTDSHRCPRRPVRVAVEIIAVGLLGGLVGLLLVAVFDPRGQITDMDSISIVAGALVAIGINRALRG